MKITKRQLRRIIKEEKQKLLKESLHGIIAGVGFSPPPPSSPSIYSSQSAQSPAVLAMKRSAQMNRHRVSEVEYHGSPIGDAVKNLVIELETIRDPMERNAEIYDIIDQLEDLANRG